MSLSGVPQGSNLGPLLFILFINEVAKILSRNCRLLYADDVKIFMTVRNIDDCLELQRLINAFDNWCSINLMSLSINKCFVISFHRKLKPVIFNYSIAGTDLVRVQVIKDLGILLDRELTFKSHYQDIISRANRQLGFIFKIADEFRDLACLRSLYCSLVRSILEFSSVVWCPYHANWSSRLESVQKKIIRIALFRSRCFLEFGSYEERCRYLGILTLEQRRKVSQAMFVAKLLNGEIDAPALLNQLCLYVPVRILRQRPFLFLAPRNTDYGSHEPIRFMSARFNEFFHLFDFNLTTTIFLSRLRSNFSRQL